jgi:putative phosphoribosyl transferase
MRPSGINGKPGCGLLAVDMYREQTVFRNRTDAGKRLAEKLAEYQGSDAVVFAIPRGGVPVAVAVVAGLGLKLDLVIPRKIPIPDNPEAGYGAVTEDGVIVLNEPLVTELNLSKSQIQRQAAEIRLEIERRSAAFRSRLPRQDVQGKTAIIVDDGLASGYTMMAAVASIQHRRADRIVVAVPVASGSAYDLVKPAVSALVALVVDRHHQFAVAGFYREWHDLNDSETMKYIEEYLARQGR